MKGLILAGGFATRLRPLSCSKPKLLFPVAGVPLIDLMIAELKKGGVREVILAVNHLSEKLKLEVGERRLGSTVRFSVETEPLGTAGPIRFARPLLDEHENLLVVNGDIVSDIDIGGMVKAHKANSAMATVALVSVPDAREYGSVSVDKDGRVLKFEEKTPSYSKSSLVNAGVYVLSPEILNFIPRRGPASLERAVFPVLAKRNAMWSWQHTGYWHDIGRIPEYVRANMDMLQKQGTKAAGRLERPQRDSSVVPPCYLGKASRLSVGVQVGPNAILSDGVMVNRDSRIRNSIIFEDTIIGERCVVNGALIGERVVVGKDSRVGRGAIVAGEISVPEGSTITDNSIVLT